MLRYLFDECKQNNQALGYHNSIRIPAGPLDVPAVEFRDNLQALCRKYNDASKRCTSQLAVVNNSPSDNVVQVLLEFNTSGHSDVSNASKHNPKCSICSLVCFGVILSAFVLRL